MKRQWTLTAEGERKFNFGHPWIFASDISSPIQSAVPGQLVQVASPRGHLLGLTYANPHSQIVLRRLSRNAETTIDQNWVISQLLKAAQYRHQLGLSFASHRWVFSEADDLPGLIIDVFFSSTPQKPREQIIICEVLTAGAEVLWSHPQNIVQGFLQQMDSSWGYLPWEQTTVVTKRDHSFRRMEKLEMAPTEIVGSLTQSELESLAIDIQKGTSINETLPFCVDLIQGQKTGFFLDQRENIHLLLNHMQLLQKKSIRVLDLFCYVGQWSGQIAAFAKKLGMSVHVTAVDASQKALDLVQKNIKADSLETLKMDIVEKCQQLPENSFDIVICDPPALIKSKKDLHAGTSAYIKVNTAALKSLTENGLYVSCSCSQHLDDEALKEVLMSSLRKAHKDLFWLAHGQQAADHPLFLEFPQGNYLNCWLGIQRSRALAL